MKEARQFINKIKAEAQRNIEFEKAEVERKKKLPEKEQHVRYMLTRRSRRPGGLCVPQPADTTSSEDDQTDDPVARSDGEGFEEVKRRDVKQKRKKRSSNTIKAKFPRTQVVALKRQMLAQGNHLMSLKKRMSLCYPHHLHQFLQLLPHSRLLIILT